MTKEEIDDFITKYFCPKTPEEARKVLEGDRCPRCDLEAKTLLHPFCQHRVCPVREALKYGD